MAQPTLQRVAGADPVKVDPGHYRLELENEYMRVLRARYGPHERSVMHRHPDFVGLFLTDVHTRFTFPDGRTEDLEWNAGQVYWGFAGDHLPENLGDKPTELLLFEPKPKTPAIRPVVTHDPIRVDPAHYRLELDSERVRVLRATYGPYEKSVMHGHPACAVAFLTDHHVRFTYPNGKREEIVGQAGQLRWFSRVAHLPENLAGTPLELILVETKE